MAMPNTSGMLGGKCLLDIPINAPSPVYLTEGLVVHFRLPRVEDHLGIVMFLKETKGVINCVKVPTPGHCQM